MHNSNSKTGRLAARIFTLCALCLCAGCLTLRDAERPMAAATPLYRLPPPTLKPGMALDIRVLVDGDVEIDETAKRVRNDGSLVLPLLGSVAVEQFTLDELTALLEQLYDERYFVNPSVDVEFSPVNDDAVSPWGSVTVLGRVNSPGPVGIPPTRDLTVSRAIKKAGGLDDSARSSAIRVSRARPTGGAQQLQVNLNDVGVNGDQAADILLRPGDIVFVPESIF